MESSLPPMVDSAGAADEQNECPATQLDDDDDEDVERAQDEQTTTAPQQSQAHSAAHESTTHPNINDRESHSIVIYRTFVHIPIPTVSEGQQTSSTGARIGVNPRRARAHREASQSASAQPSLHSS